MIKELEGKIMNPYLCPVKVELDDGEILICRRGTHTDTTHRDWMTEFVKIDDGTYAIRRFEIVVEEVV